MIKHFREPINTLTHLIGVIASLIGLIFMITKVYTGENFFTPKMAGAIIFGLSLIFLYAASSLYHLVKVSDKALTIFRKVDHSMIFILIAGTYTPICLMILSNPIKTIVLSIVWSLTILGILLKVFWFNCPRALYTSFYIIMGWMALFLIIPIYKTLLLKGLLWLIAGGVLYTIGGIIYAKKSPNICSKFGFHELFHVFVLLGSCAHFYLIYNFVL
ncbi:PAQR family membrane homeostasis protein TrhA [Clostridium fallax]|uniref:Hemolysin III n=1 Tax=Clostridium fallax TaxID=1533 RepID=A0A1M4SU95_9CLOT|nr:hemolysin III family protein [Clostridium fallax]SHE35749.1 hemolysin III [Clostridium fallax]SQB07974.1 putative hemolysin III [Clostridium fallax]